MRRNRIHVSSGTYCSALAQFERRMMSQMDLTKADSERVPAMAFGVFCFGCFLKRGIELRVKNLGEELPWQQRAPLQWLTVKGLQNYGQDALAKDIADRWISLNVKVFKETGKLMEKYDVQDTTKLAGGGEYPGQDGFGWTNGVLLKLISIYGMPNKE